MTEGSSNKPVESGKSGLFHFLLKPWFLVPFNLGLFLVSLFFSLKTSNFNILAGSGAILSVSGLLLSIKHNLLVEFTDIKKAVGSKKGLGVLSTSDPVEQLKFEVETLRILKEEKLGVFLTIIGAFIGGYGGLLSKSMFCH